MKSINWKKLALELLVVFLGVTGGFVLNNWQDIQKEKKLESNYIESFIQNIESNIEEISSIIRDDSIWFVNMNVKLKLLEKDSLSLDSQATVIHDILMVSNLSIETSTFEDIKFSGNLNMIRDYQLKENIVKYHNKIDGALFVDNYYNNYFSSFVMPYVMTNFDLANDAFFDNYEKGKLFNITAGYYSMRQQRSANIKELLQSSFVIKKQLEDYIR